MSRLEDVLKQLTNTVEEASAPLIVAGLHAALARITTLEKQWEDSLTAKVKLQGVQAQAQAVIEAQKQISAKTS